MELGDRLRQARLEKGLSLRELAKAASVSHGFLADIERSRSAPSIATLKVIARELGTSVAGLIGETAPSRPAVEEDALPAEAQKMLDEFGEFLRQRYGRSKR